MKAPEMKAVNVCVDMKRLLASCHMTWRVQRSSSLTLLVVSCDNASLALAPPPAPPPHTFVVLSPPLFLL